MTDVICDREVSSMKLRTALSTLLLALAMLFIALPASADVWLPASLTEIESQAFMNSAWLSGNCTIPDGVKSIGAQAFYNCSGLTTLSIPDSVGYIGSKAFAGCTGLTGTVTIPKGCEMAADAFEGCTGLTVITESEDPSELFTWSITGGEATITGYKGGKTVTSITVPATIEGCPVTAIADYVFSSSRYLTHVSLPHTLETIGNYAFAYCSRLTSVSMPASVTSVGRYAFYYSSQLAGEIALIDAEIPSNAFTGCKNLSVFAYDTNADGTLTLARYYGSQRSVSVPHRVNGRTVTAIGREAFSYRTALVSVMLPTSVTTIGQSAFYYCSALESVSIPYGVTSIGPSAFYYCTSLTQLSLPETVESIGSMAFYSCSALHGTYTFVNASINASAFSSCEGVTAWCYRTVTATEAVLEACYSSASAFSVPAYVDDYAVSGMSAQAFYGCRSITSVTLPETFRTISAEAFYKCATLQSISIPEGVTAIGENAFCGCTSLTSVVIPASMDSIASQAFYNCTGMTSLTVRSAATELRSFAFAGCSSLSSISMPGDFSNVGNMALNGTPWLNAKVSAIARQVTSGCSSDYDRALALHDWLVTHTAYDNSYTHYGSEGVLFHGTGVCNAYTLTYSRLLSAVGVSSMTVSGTATDRNTGNTGGHAWTLVKLDGVWYHVDTTWDDPIPDGRERHTYFCLTDAQMAVDHSWDTSAYPAANGSAITTAAAVATLSLEEDTADEASVTSLEAEEAGEDSHSNDNGKDNQRQDKRKRR